MYSSRKVLLAIAAAAFIAGQASAQQVGNSAVNPKINILPGYYPNIGVSSTNRFPSVSPYTNPTISPWPSNPYSTQRWNYPSFPSNNFYTPQTPIFANTNFNNLNNPFLFSNQMNNNWQVGYPFMTNSALNYGFGFNNSPFSPFGNNFASPFGVFMR